MPAGATKKIPFMFFFAIVFTLYLATLAPGISWANSGVDGGDYLSALNTGGIPHPTGYPTYLLLAKVIYLVPFGSLAFRGNLFSAITKTWSFDRYDFDRSAKAVDHQSAQSRSFNILRDDKQWPAFLGGNFKNRNNVLDI